MDRKLGWHHPSQDFRVHLNDVKSPFEPPTLFRVRGLRGFFMPIESFNYQVQIPNAVDYHEASVVASWTEGEHMLPKTQQNILDLFQRGHSVLVYKTDEALMVGHAAVTAIYPGETDLFVEIGTVITNPAFRQQGIGHVSTIAAVTLAENLYPGSKKIAMANAKSTGLFAQLGALAMGTAELPPGTWDFCKTSCKFLPTQNETGPFICCDTPYNLTSIARINEHISLTWYNQSGTF